MCGIVGLILTEKKPVTELWNLENQNACLMNLGKIPTVLRDLIYFDAVRGWDGTGYLQVDNIYKGDPLVRCFKKDMNAADFLNDSRTIAMLNNMDKYRIHIAHNRYATKGGKNSKNAHPFHEKNIWAVHNGSITSIKGMDDFYKFQVDSEAATAYMQREGVVKFAQNVIGTYTFVWFDESDTSFHILRNEDRPLRMFKTDKYIAFSSEGGLAMAAITRNGHKIIEEIEIKAGTHYQIDYFSNEGLKIESQALEMYQAPPTPVYQGNSKNAHSHTGSGANTNSKGTAYSTWATQDEISKGIDLKIGGTYTYIPCNREQYTHATGDTGWYLLSDEVMNGVPVIVKTTPMTRMDSEKFVGEYVNAEIVSVYHNAPEDSIVIMVRNLEILDEVSIALFDQGLGNDYDPKVTKTVKEFISEILTAKALPAIATNPAFTTELGACSVCGVSTNKGRLQPIPKYATKHICDHCLSDFSFVQDSRIIQSTSTNYHQQSSAVN
jgi:hypothetical protein